LKNPTKPQQRELTNQAVIKSKPGSVPVIKYVHSAKIKIGTILVGGNNESYEVTKIHTRKVNVFSEFSFDILDTSGLTNHTKWFDSFTDIATY